MRISSIIALVLFSLVEFTEISIAKTLAADGAQKAENINDLVKALSKAKKKHKDKEAKATKLLNGSFQALKKSIQLDNATRADVRTNLIVALVEEETAFQSNRTLPTSEGMATSSCTYLESTRQTLIPLIVAYNSLIAAHLAAGELESSKQMAAELALVENRLPGRNTFQPQTNWKGTRFNPTTNNSVDADFWVGQFNGKSFIGTIWMDRGMIEMRVKGTIDGNFVHLEITEMIRGAARNLVFEGFVIEKIMVLNISGQAAGGGMASGYLHLRKEFK